MVLGAVWAAGLAFNGGVAASLAEAKFLGPLASFLLMEPLVLPAFWGFVSLLVVLESFLALVFLRGRVALL